MQEEIDHKDDEDDGDDERLHHIMDGGKEEVVGGFENLEFQPGRHRRFQILVELVDAGVHLGGIGTRCLKHHENGARIAIHA